jgi:hypothetical protein
MGVSGWMESDVFGELVEPEPGEMPPLPTEGENPGGDTVGEKDGVFIRIGVVLLMGEGRELLLNGRDTAQ